MGLVAPWLSAGRGRGAGGHAGRGRLAATPQRSRTARCAGRPAGPHGSAQRLTVAAHLWRAWAGWPPRAGRGCGTPMPAHPARLWGPWVPAPGCAPGGQLARRPLPPPPRAMHAVAPAAWRLAGQRVRPARRRGRGWGWQPRARRRRPAAPGRTRCARPCPPAGAAGWQLGEGERRGTQPTCWRSAVPGWGGG
jgi:hypothetical protein